MRIRGAKTELEEAGLETEGMVESTAKLREEILALSGVDIMEIDGETFKSTYKIMDELAVKWEELTDIQQASITELIAGKRQGNIVSSLMTNFDTARDALETSLGSEDSMTTEHEKWQKSLESSINSLKASWQSLSQTFLDSDFLKSSISVLTSFVDILEKLIDTFGVLGTIGLGVFGKNIFGHFKNAKKSIEETTVATQAATIANQEHAASEEVKAVATNNDTIATDANTTAEVANTTATNNDTVAENANTIAEQSNTTATNNDTVATNANTVAETANTTATNNDTVATNANTTAEVANTTATNADTVAENANTAAEVANTTAKSKLTKVTGKLGTGISGLIGKLGGWLSVLSIAVTVIGAVTNAIKKQREEQAAQRQETIDSANAFLDASKSFELAYIKYADKTSLTAEEEADLESAIKGTVDALGDKSSALQNAVNSGDDYIDSLKRIQNEVLKTEESKAKEKYTNAKESLKESANKWWTGTNDNIVYVHDPKAIKIAEKIDSDFYGMKEIYYGSGGGSAETPVFEIPSDADCDKILDFYNDLLEYKEGLIDAGFENESQDMKSLNDFLNRTKEAIETYKSAKLDLKKAEYLVDHDPPKTSEDYIKMRREMIEGIGGDLKYRKEVANILDEHYGSVFDLSSVEFQARQFDKIIKAYGDGSKDGTNDIGTVETFLNMRTAVNNNECTIGQYMDAFNDVKALEKNYSKEEKEYFETSLGLDTDKIKDQYHDAMRAFVVGRGKPYDDWVFEAMEDVKAGKVPAAKSVAEFIEFEEYLSSLTATELQALVNLKPKIDWENGTIDSIIKQVEEEAKLIEAISFTVDLDIETEKLENLSKTVSESLSGAGLGTESMSLVEDMFGDLDGYDPTALFERTANGIRLNAEEYRKLSDEYKKENIDGLEGKLDALGTRYNQTREELSDLTYGSAEYNKKLNELDGIEAQINDTETLLSMYKGLNSAYQSWQRAESSGSQRDMYENMIKGFETVGDEISRGWLDDGTIEFLRLIKGESLSATATTKDYMKAWNSLDDTIKNTTYSVRDFFTVDEDGNSTNGGVYNFLDAIGQLEEEEFGGKDVVKRDKDGNIIGFDFKIVGGDKAIADALGISEELVQIMVRAADDAGFVVSMDGTYQQLDTLKEKAQDAANKLKDTFGKTDFEFNLNTGNEKSIQDQYTEALKIWAEFAKNKNQDGTVNMDVEGAEEAFTLVSTLQSMVDRLSEPAYMKLDATQVEKDMKTPLSKLQEYERLTQQENQLKLKGTDTSEIDKSQEEILDYFEGLDPEIQASIGIKGDSREEIQQKLESGEIEIPATVDLQVEMNDTLRDMVNVALYNAGLLGEGEEGKAELKKRVDIELYAENVDTEDVDEAEKEAIEDTKAKTRKKNVKIIAKTIGIEDVDNLSEKLKNLDDKTIKAIAEVLGQVDVEKLKDTMAKLEPTQVEAIAKAIGQGDVDGLKESISSLSPTYVQAIAEAFGYTDVQDLYNAIEKLDPKTVEAVANALGITDVESLKGAIDNVQGKDVEVKATTSGEGALSGLKSLIDSIKSKSVTIKSFFKKITSGGSTRNDSNGFSDVNGTAHANGTVGRAYSRGDWTIKNSGTALGGELGTEILVRNGRWFTIGDNGAEFFQYKKGDIIFNHRQSEELLRNGRVASNGGRGKAFAEGTAFSNGSTGLYGLKKVIGEAVEAVKSFTKKTSEKASEKKNDNKSSGNNESSGSGSSGGNGGTGNADTLGNKGGDSVGTSESEKDKFEETIDFVEIAISRIEREINNLDRTANNVYKSWSERNTALASEISKVSDEIEVQQQGYKRYLAEANSVGLSETWASKVRNGTIDIYDEKNFDEDTAKKIKEYQQWYEKALSCKDAVDELKETEASLYKQRFDNVQAQYDGILQGYEHTETMLNEYISQAEAKGYIVSEKYYDALITNEKQNINKLKDEQAALIAARDKAVDEGKIIKGSQAWVDMCNEIDSVTQAIEEGNTALIEYNNSIRDIEWEKFDLIQERISDITAEANFLIELMSNKKLFNDDGKLTEQGASTMGLHGQNYNTYMYQADDYGKEVAKLDKQIAKDPYDKELINRRRELIELQRESILNAEQEKNAIKDLVEEGINLELDALQEKIDLHNEELDSMKNLYEYQENVKEQTAEIASLQKQLSAYSGDNSEEAQKKVQELKVSLEEAEKDLQETEWDRYIDQQSQLLDSLYTEYETILNSRLDNIDFLLEQVIDGINAAAGTDGTLTSALGVEGAIAQAIVNAMGENGTMKGILNTEATKVGTTLSNAMNNIWSVGEGNAKSVLTEYGKGFQSKQTTTNTVLGNIKADVAAMVDDIDKDAKKKVEAPKTQSSAKVTPIKNAGKNVITQANNNNKKDSKANITEDTLMGVAASIWNYQKENYGGWGANPTREKRLTDKLGAENAKKVQSYINAYGANGKLYNFWISKNKNLDKYKYNAFKSGAKNISKSQYAWTQEDGQELIVRPSDGAILTPVAKRDSVLNTQASENLWNMTNSPAEFIKDNLNFNTSNVPNNSNVQSNLTQHFENITFNMPNVKNYEQLISEMQRDKNFENLILSMTVNQIAGKSKLAKGKAIR